MRSETILTLGLWVLICVLTAMLSRMISDTWLGGWIGACTLEFLVGFIWPKKRRP